MHLKGLHERDFKRDIPFESGVQVQKREKVYLFLSLRVD